MGKVSEFICEAFEDMCIAEKLHKQPDFKTAEDLKTIKEHIKKAYIRLWNFYGDENRAALACTCDVIDTFSVEKWAFSYGFDSFCGLCMMHNILDVFEDYRKDYFSIE